MKTEEETESLKDRTETADPALPEPFAKYVGSPAWRSFLEDASEAQETDTLLSLSLPVRGLDPLACLEILQQEKEFHYYLEKPDEERAIAGAGTCRTLTASGENRFQEIRRKVERIRERTRVFNPGGHSMGGPLILGGFSFFDTLDSEEWDGFAPALFTVPRWSVYREGGFNLLTLTLESGTGATAEELDRRIRRELSALSPIFELDITQVLQAAECDSGRGNPRPADENGNYGRWRRAVARATEQIRNGKYRKIVLARKLTAPRSGQEATCLLNTLRGQYPGCYSFLVKPEGADRFLGCTPERLAAFHKSRLLTEALAGSMGRGGTASEDAMFGKELLQSGKNREEHDLVIRDIESRLEPFVKSIDRARIPALKKLSNVQHLHTPVTAWLSRETDPLTLVESLHPTSAVGGYPWNAASPHIRELEQFDRGWYAGPLGWMTLGGEGMFTVAIRSALMSGDRISCFAGCGIVMDSDPRAEWRETWLKLEPMLSALHHD